MRAHARSLWPVWLLVGCVTPQIVTTSGRPHHRYSAEQFLGAARIGGASFSADEHHILCSSDRTGIFNAYAIAVTGGGLRPLTASTKESTFGVSFFPRDDRLLYRRDAGGDENSHLFVRELDGRERDLTPGPKVKAEFLKWTRDERAFYVSTNARDPKFFDIYRIDARTYQATLFYQDDVGYQIGDIAEDGQWIALTRANTTADSDVFLWRVADKQLQRITPHRGVASYDVSTFDPESRWLYYLTNDGSEFIRSMRYQLATGAVEEVERANWDILFTRFSQRGTYRVTGINEDGRTVIRVVETKSGRPLALPRLPEADISSVVISRSERLMAFYVNGDRAPNDLYVLDLRTGKVVRLTNTLHEAIDPDDLVEAQTVRFQSFDGMVIPNILYKPHDASAARPAPALIWVHGGPGGQTRRGYFPLLQFLANHGYVVLAINNRGSSGYGKTFFVADDRKHGREPLWDCVAAKQYLASLPYVDAKRIGIIGGSYGGYMVLAALTFRPDVFEVGVDLFGVANWLRTMTSMPSSWASMRQALYAEMGDPVKDRAMLHAISPLFHAERIRKPLLVLQGANDPRVLKVESDEMVAAVRKHGVRVTYVIFDDEGHGFTKRKNQITGWRAMLEFLERELKRR